MITIATFNNSAEAYAAKALLESNGIHCELRGDLHSEAEAIGNIELLINAKDSRSAAEVLANATDQE